MAEYQAANSPEQNYIIDSDQSYQSNYQGIVQVLRGPQCTARESDMGLLEIYQFEARTGDPIRDLKGGACSLHLESGSCSFPPLPSPLNFSGNCQCQCACSPCPSPCCPPPCLPVCPYPPRPVESCLPGLHQKYRDFYPDCKENHLPISYRNFVEHDDLYLPSSRPISSASNYCNRPTSSRSWSPPSPPSQQKCHCGAAQYQSAHARPGSPWDIRIPESKPCFQTFFHASPTTTHPDRSESLYIVETPLQKSPGQQPHSRSTSPMQTYLKSCLSPPSSGVKDLVNTSCQCSPRINTDPGSKSFHTQKSGARSPLSPYNPEHPPYPSPSSPQKCPSHYPLRLPESPSRALNRLPYATELVTVEKHVQCNCSPQLGSADFDQSYTRRPQSPSLYDTGASIRRILRPESPFRTTPHSSRLECTCHPKPGGRGYNQLHYPTQNGSRSQSPSQSSSSTAQHRNVEPDLNFTTFLNDVKRILTSDVPPRLSPTNRNHDLKQDYYSKLNSTLKPEFPSKDYSSSERTDQKQENLSSMDFFLRVRSTLKPALPSVDFSSSGRTDRWQEFLSRDNVASSGRQDWKQVFPSKKARIKSRLEATDWRQEFPSRDNFSSSGRKADWKQSWDYPSNLNWEFSSGLRATDRRQEYASCVRTTERASSPIVVTPIITESGPNYSREIDLADRPETAPTSLSNPINSEAPRKSRPLQSGNDLNEATKTSSTRRVQANVSPATESDEDYRYGPVQATPTAAESKHLAKPTFSKQDTTTWFSNRDVIRRCCCGMCKNTYSRSHFTTKCPFCANVHSCCSGMCSCPFPSCTSKSPIPDSDSSNYASTTSSPSNDNLHRFPSHKGNPGFSSRPKSLSPMRRTYLAGLGLPDKYRPRSKSTRSRCKIQEKDFEPSPRTLLESFHRYLKSESRRARTGSSPLRRCPERRSAHWNPPSMYSGRNCSQQTKRLSTRKTPKVQQQQQAPWGTHPILLSSKPPYGQALEYRLPHSGSHRGCCCPRCINGKL